jgi:hypothetical protein
VIVDAAPSALSKLGEPARAPGGAPGNPDACADELGVDLLSAVDTTQAGRVGDLDVLDQNRIRTTRADGRRYFAAL